MKHTLAVSLTFLCLLYNAVKLLYSSINNSGEGLVNERINHNLTHTLETLHTLDHLQSDIFYITRLTAFYLAMICYNSVQD